ncbi:MAG TPA: DUF4023 family protein [Bacillales bacterium]|nr:DUF4023 family protein [Bacillales bacterium]
MKNTSEFVARIHDKQQKDEQNRKHGKGHPEKRLPNKSHSQSKMGE